MPRTKSTSIDKSNSKVESVACYIRVSTEEQAMHGISLAAQEEKLRAYAKEHNMRIVEWYKDEGVSGRKEIKKRPELQRMIQDAEKGMFERIIFIKLDRFFRSVAEYHECMKRISPVIWTATEEKYDQSTANGRMFINMKLTVAELEADQTGERIKIVNDYKVTTGQPLVGKHSLPFGYMVIVDEHTNTKKIVKDPSEEHIVYDLLEHFQTYQSRRKTLIYINEKYGLSYSVTVIKRLLSNPLLCGEYRGNTSYISEPYIDRQTFDYIQEISQRNIKRNTIKREYIFSGLIKCPFCGCLLSGGIYYHYDKRYQRRYTYKMYRCCKQRATKLCEFNKYPIETTLEKLMLENIEKYLDDAKRIVSAKIQDVNAFSTPQKSITEINERIDRLNYSWQTGKIRTPEQYEKQYAELAKELEEVKKAQSESVVKDFSKVEAVLQSGWRKIYASLDDEHKQAFWRSFVESIEIDWGGKEKKITKVNFI